MYRPSSDFDRTPEEKRDMFKSWARDDRPFFAAGACHILAALFVQLHQHENYYMVFVKPAEGYPGTHVYATDGTWAFDHNGWHKEATLKELMQKAYSEKYPGWQCEFIPIESSTNAFENFCKENNHRLPWQYAYLPWERAYKYIAQFPGKPPHEESIVIDL
jgi:hypothetical protein